MSVLYSISLVVCEMNLSLMKLIEAYPYWGQWGNPLGSPTIFCCLESEGAILGVQVISFMLQYHSKREKLQKRTNIVVFHLYEVPRIVKVTGQKAQ